MTVTMCFVVVIVIQVYKSHLLGLVHRQKLEELQKAEAAAVKIR